MSRSGKHCHKGSDVGGSGYAYLRSMTTENREALRKEGDVCYMPLFEGKGGRSKKALIVRACNIKARDNRAEQAERNGHDLWHVLVEFGTRKKIKMAAMSRIESFRRNATIRELGMEWTLGTM